MRVNDRNGGPVSPTRGGNVRRTKGARIIHCATLKLITIHHQMIPLVSQHSGEHAAPYFHATLADTVDTNHAP